MEIAVQVLPIRLIGSVFDAKKARLRDGSTALLEHSGIVTGKIYNYHDVDYESVCALSTYIIQSIKWHVWS